MHGTLTMVLIRDSLDEVSSSASSDGEDSGPDLSRDHYEIVGESKLQKLRDVELGIEYTGSRIDRSVLLNEHNLRGTGQPAKPKYYGSSDEDDQAEDRSEERFDGFEEDARGEIQNGATSDTELSDQSGSEGETVINSYQKSKEAEVANRAELRTLLADSQTRVLADIKSYAKADAEKGSAVKTQLQSWDRLLRLRMKLQQGIGAINTFSTQQLADSHSQTGESVKKAEGAAVKLWNGLAHLRGTLPHSGQINHRDSDAAESMKRGALTTTDELYLETSQYHKRVKHWRQSILNKWSSKIRASTVSGGQDRGSDRLRLQTNSEQRGSEVLSGYLATNMTRLMEKMTNPSRVTRDERETSVGDNRIFTTRDEVHDEASRSPEGSQLRYDDTSFYQLLLQDLISRRLDPADASNGFAPDPMLNGSKDILTPHHAIREARVKRTIDTRASKGRKLRYTIHEKLQDYIAPIDTETWGARQREELFGSLLGQRLTLNELNEEDETEADGLRLFAGPPTVNPT